MPVERWHFALLFDVNGIRACGGGMACLISLCGHELGRHRDRIGGGVWHFPHESVCCLAEPRQALLCGSSLAAVVISVRMWAYVHGPIGLVAPLRESGIVFGGRALPCWYCESPSARLQLMAVGLAAVGVVLVQIG